jgi:hypothetical protein
MPLPGLRGSAVRFKRFRGCGNARFMLLITGILLILAACAASSSAPVDDEAALKTVQAFVAALEARDPSAVLAILEPADWRREIGPELRSYMSYVEALEFQNPAYELLANDGNTAEIRLRADLRYRLRDFEPGEQAVDTVFELVRIDDEWYLRSLNLPTPGS